MHAITKSLLVAAILSALSCGAFAAVIVVEASTVLHQASNYREDQPTTVLAAGNVWAGSLSATAALRGVMSFDLSGVSLGVGESISSVTLDLFYRTPDSGGLDKLLTVGIYQLNESYTTGQVSWANRATGTLWSTAGGSFEPPQLSSAEVSTKGVALTAVPQFGSTSAFVNTVTLAVGSTDFGILFRAPAQEGLAERAYANMVGYTTNSTYSPKLTITTVPEPTTVVLTFLSIGGLAVFGLVRRSKMVS
jgi:hypothetical protein